MKIEKIYCVVVTYNRLELLKENIAALQCQTYPIDKIIIINNNSTDGTQEYLKQWEDSPLFQIINSPTNMGGSAGFCTGIKEAVQSGGDWIWVMDDDTIPTPTALEYLAKSRSLTDRVGFISSKVKWTNGSTHLMNIPNIQRIVGEIPFNEFSDKGVFLIDSTSFVSTLISTKAVKEAGLPISSFFIWGDDCEFTNRIHKHGYLGLYINDSLVIHKTLFNYSSNLATAPDNVAWKFFYEMRNTLFLRRKRKKTYIEFFFSSLFYLKRNLTIIKKRKGEQEAFRKAICAGFKAGLKFNPQIEYIQDNK